MPTPPRSTRRQFLTGIAARKQLESVLDGPSSHPAPASHASQRAANLLLEIGRQAMACSFQVLLNANQYPHGAEAADDGLERVCQLEAQLSVYRDSSELSQLNRRAAVEEVPVSETLFELLSYASKLTQETGGAYDVSTGALTKAWGFFRREGSYPDDEQLQAALRQCGMKHVVLNHAARSVRYQVTGLEVNLGSIGKGYALDACADALLAQGITHFLIHGGQSSMLAQGNRLGARRPGWCVSLRHPQRQERVLGNVWLENQALGTSGSGKQFFHFGGKRYGHVLDPRTGQPASGILSATVLAPAGYQADAIATAMLVMGVEATEAFCREHSQLTAILVTGTLDSERVEVITLGAQGDAFEAAEELK